MIKKLRYQFIALTMGCISFIFALILVVINISMTVSSNNRGYALLYRIAEASEPRSRDFNTLNQPSATPPNTEANKEHREFLMPPEMPIGGLDFFRSFSVLYDAEGNIANIRYNEDSGLDEETIRQIADNVRKKESTKDKGISSKYLYIIKEKPEGEQIFFLDYSLEKNISLRLFWICLFIGLAGILVIFLLVVYLSHWIIKPVQMAFDRQKQFIADASHELKTPLTIITTNAEVLEGSLPGNRWLSHILTQTRRMNVLIKNLLDLARLDAYDKTMNFMDFDLSKAVKNAALSFESLAFEYGKTYEMNIAEDILFHGNESSLKQLTTILLDNAFKYSDEQGSILLQLRQQGEKKILSIENTGQGIPFEEQQRIFERFYRSDTSRSRESGGYGLGLAIAASIAQIHQGHLSVKSDGHSYTRFTLTLP